MTISSKDIEAYLAGAKPRRRSSKYHNVWTRYNGVPYQSKAEAKRAQELDWLMKAGEVLKVERQPLFHLGCPENVYRGDFLVTGRDGSRWVEDVKGYVTPKFKRDVRLWQRYGTLPLHIITGKETRVVTPQKTEAR